MSPLTGNELTEVLTLRFRSNAQSLDLKQIATFCGIRNPSTVKSWLDKHKPMGGLAGLKLWHLLAQLGVDSPELDQIRRDYPEGEYLGRLLAFGVLSLDEACKMCDVQKDAILRAARNQNQLLHCPTLDNLKKEYDELLAIATGKFPKILSSKAGVSKKPVPNPQKLLAIPSKEWAALQQRLDDTLEALRIVMRVTTQPHTGDEQVTFLLVKDVAEKLQVATVAANVAISQFSSDQRDLLRIFMGPRAMFDLSNVLERLCTERAFHEGA